MIVNIYFITYNYVVCCIKVCCIQVLLYSNTYVKVCSSLLLKKKILCNCGIRDEESNNFFPFFGHQRREERGSCKKIQGISYERVL